MSPTTQRHDHVLIAEHFSFRSRLLKTNSIFICRKKSKTQKNGNNKLLTLWKYAILMWLIMLTHGVQSVKLLFKKYLVAYAYVDIGLIGTIWPVKFQSVFGKKLLRIGTFELQAFVNSDLTGLISTCQLRCIHLRPFYANEWSQKLTVRRFFFVSDGIDSDRWVFRIDLHSVIWKRNF